MLGRLLHTAASSLNPNASSPRSHASLQSVTEEAHTTNLLFPDASLLQQSQDHEYPLHTASPTVTAAAAGSFDNKGEWDIRSSQDIRIIVAQDAIGPSDLSTVLFDSKPPPARPSPPKSVVDEYALAETSSQSLQDTTLPASVGGAIGAPPLIPHRNYTPRTPIIPRPPLASRSSQTIANSAPQAYKESDGAILRSSLRGKPQQPALTESESVQSRLASEAEDEQRSLVNCMFGVTVFSYKGPSTKLHILPVENGQGGSSTNTSPVVDRGHGPTERAEAPKRSHLQRSVTASSFRSDLDPPSPGMPNSSGNTVRSRERSTVLVTRMFSVNVPNTSCPSEASHELDEKAQTGSSGINGYPFPDVGPNGLSKSKKIKQRKTPMYGIAIVLQLPAIHRGSSTPPSRSGSRNTSLWNGQDSFTLHESENRHSMSVLDPRLGSKAYSINAAPLSDLDERLDQIVRHWDVITRTLSYLQSLTSKKILASLEAEMVVSPPSLAAPVNSDPSLPGMEQRPLKEMKVRATNQPSLRLKQNALMGNQDIQREAKSSGVRIALGLKIPRAVTGQGRWGVWREEARWVARWAAGKEQNFFFFNLLTAFLGNHTGWLALLGPSLYKGRHFHQQRTPHSEQGAIPNRTVIVSSDKMASRRLIFLLSTFLPATHTSLAAASPHRPSSSTSFRAYSQSPPSGIPLLRQESLRRTINKRARGHRVGVSDPRSHKRVTSFPSHDSNQRLKADPVRFLSGHSGRQPGTRLVEAASLPTTSSGTITRKTSTTTTSTATPNKAVPVPHFIPHGSEECRPSSRGSMASLTLRQTLNRSESTNVSNNSTESQPTSRWGSLISGFWSNRRESSTDESDLMASSQEGLGISGLNGPGDLTTQLEPKTKLATMADEASRKENEAELFVGDMDGLNTRSSTTVQASVMSKDWSPTPAKAIPERPKLCESPLNLSVDEHDGVVDVDLPLPRGLSSSFGSHTSSPTKAYHTPSSSLDGYTSGRPSSRMDSDATTNVGGWLKRYHEDFALQAVTPYADLIKDVKRSMEAEPSPNPSSVTPHGEDGPADKWVDVCTTLIADTQTFSITRLCLRRRIKLTPPPPVSTSADLRPSTPAHSQYGNPYTAAQLTPGFGMSDNCLEEEMIEEPIMDMDGILIDAVERVIAQSGPSSKAQSNASSRSSSKRGRHEKRGSEALPTLEVPRGECKRMVLGALEEVVRSVTADWTLEERGEGQGRGKALRGSSSAASLRSLPAESTLREGIRKWLQDMDEVY